MIDLILHHSATLAVCIALGVGTAWWMFRGDRTAKAAPKKTEGDEA